MVQPKRIFSPVESLPPAPPVLREAEETKSAETRYSFSSERQRIIVSYKDKALQLFNPGRNNISTPVPNCDACNTFTIDKPFFASHTAKKHPASSHIGENHDQPYNPQKHARFSQPPDLGNFFRNSRFREKKFTIEPYTRLHPHPSGHQHTETRKRKSGTHDTTDS